MPPRPDQRRDLALPRAERRARGAYYTPADVVRYIVGETLRGSGRVLDPACGDGAFLCEVAERLASGAKDPLADLQRSLFGIDCDAAAVGAARNNVAKAVLGPSATTRLVRQAAAKLADNIIVGDALLDPLPTAWPKAFDAVVGNPPYVNIRQLAHLSVAEAGSFGATLTKLAASATDRYRKRFRCARRGFDLYVLFIERALELLREGGRCGLIVPNKLATLDYAAPCRTLLIEETRIDVIADFSDLDLFEGASVYPHVIVFEKGKPKADHRVQIAQASSLPHRTRADTIPGDTGRLEACPTAILQSQLNRRGVFDWQSGFDVESRVATRPLGELCRLHSGTTGFVAQKIAGELKEREDAGEPAFPFITSGNIDRYRVLLGDVRYMQRKFHDPVLPCESRLLTPAKRRLFAGPKIVFAGMSKRLEAAWCDQPLALGVQVFAAAEIQVDPFYLLALLNSRLLSHLFRTRFSAKRLAGGYLSVNKGQLAQLPIADPQSMNRGERKLVQRLSQLGRAWSKEANDLEIDRLACQLYRLSAEEIAGLQQAFGDNSLRAA